MRAGARSGGSASIAGPGRLRRDHRPGRDRLERLRRLLRRRRGLGCHPAVVDARRSRPSRRRGGPRRRDPGLAGSRRPAHDGPPPVPTAPRPTSSSPATGRTSSSGPPSIERLGRVVLLDARGAPATAARSSRSTPTPGTSRRRSTRRPTTISSNRAAGSGRQPSSGPGSRACVPRPSQPAPLSPAAPVVTSCGSGVSATHASLAMRLAGLPDPILYVGSYSDWSKAGEAVATGRSPGPRPIADRRTTDAAASAAARPPDVRRVEGVDLRHLSGGITALELGRQPVVDEVGHLRRHHPRTEAEHLGVVRLRGRAPPNTGRRRSPPEPRAPCWP